MDWLPLAAGASNDPQENREMVQQALKELAQMLVAEHNDHTLADLLQPPFDALSEATMELSAAINDDTAGDRDGGYLRARRAADCSVQP